MILDFLIFFVFIIVFFLANHRFMCSFGLLNAYQSGICLEQALVSKEAP